MREEIKSSTPVFLQPADDHKQADEKQQRPEVRLFQDAEGVFVIACQRGDADKHADAGYCQVGLGVGHQQHHRRQKDAAAEDKVLRLTMASPGAGAGGGPVPPIRGESTTSLR